MKKIGIYILIVVAFFSMSSRANAQSSLLFTVSPARQQIVANPGEEFPIAVTFYNQSESPVVGMVKVSDFIVEDEKGTPSIVENMNQISTKYSASTWIELPFDRAGMGSHDKVVVLARIKIPKDAKPGGHYAAVYFEPVQANRPTGEAGASITPRIASLLYIRVTGPITEYSFISSMSSLSFLEYGPIEVAAKIMNKGDYHIRPRGDFMLFNSFGGKSDQKKLKEVNIFPETQYSFKTVIGQKWMLGKYKITLNALYGSKEQSMIHSISVWIFPWRVVTITLLSLVIIILFGRYFYKNFIQKEATLESELSHEKEEIERLKKRLGDKS